MTAILDPFGVLADLRPPPVDPTCRNAKPEPASGTSVGRRVARTALARAAGAVGGDAPALELYPAYRELCAAVAGGLTRQGAPWRRARGMPAVCGGRARAGWDAGDGEVCGCGGRMRYATSGAEAVCERCGRVTEGGGCETDEGPRLATGPLRIIGRGARALQTDLYRSAPGSTGETLFGSVYDELAALNAAHIAGGGRDFPTEALGIAATLFNGVQREVVRRNDQRKRMLAACLRRGCLAVGLAPADEELARFAQLAGRGIARGENSLRALAAEGKLPEWREDPDAPAAAEIATFFGRLGLGGAGPAPTQLRAAAAAVVAAAIKRNVGCESLLRAKVEGAAFVVLRRAPPALLAAAGRPRDVDLRAFCAAAGVRLNTIERFVDALAAHHSRFVQVYRKFQLDETSI